MYENMLYALAGIIEYVQAEMWEAGHEIVRDLMAPGSYQPECLYDVETKLLTIQMGDVIMGNPGTDLVVFMNEGELYVFLTEDYERLGGMPMKDMDGSWFDEPERCAHCRAQQAREVGVIYRY